MSVPNFNKSPSLLLPKMRHRAREEYARYVAGDVLAHISVLSQKHFINIDGQTLGIRKRHRIFADNQKCVFCDLSISVCIIERSQNEPWHVHFYGERSGRLVLFTLDHMIPRSHGGTNAIKNLQTMCEDCNTRKGNICTDPFAAARLRHRGTIT